MRKSRAQVDSQIRQRYKGGRQRQSLAGQRRSIKSQTHTGRKAGTPTQGNKTDRHWGARAQRLKTLGVGETSQLVAGSWRVANVTPCTNRKFQAGQTSNNKSTSVWCTDDLASLHVSYPCCIYNMDMWGYYTHAATSHLKWFSYICRKVQVTSFFSISDWEGNKSEIFFCWSDVCKTFN